MGVVHISHERNRAAIQLDPGELRQTIAALQSAVGKLGQNPVALARIWRLADDLSSRQPRPINVVTPSAAALKQRLGVDFLEELKLGSLGGEPGILHPTPPPPPWISNSAASNSNTTPLPMVSRGFGQSLEDAFASAALRGKQLQQGSPENAGESTPLPPRARASPSDSLKAAEAETQQAARRISPESRAPPSVKVTETAGLEQGVRRISPETTSWRGCFQTQAAEHNRAKVTSIIYSTELELFSGDWEQQGWLISASSNLLNLWICCKKPAGQPLELMHSQATSSIIDAMDINSAAKLLITIGSKEAQGSRVSLYSLSTETFFKYQGAIQIPDRLTPPHRSQLLAGSSSKLLHVSSLQPLRGPLSSALAVAIGGEVLIYEESAAGESSSPFITPRACWKAHESPISSMHTSRFSCNLITGACDGVVKLWDLRNKPSSPSREVCHQKLQVTGLAMVDSNTMVSSGEDSSIRMWDLRAGDPEKALWSIVPDSRPVVNLASGPGLLAATTRLGLYCVEFCGPELSSSILSPLKPLPHGGPGSMLQWNTLSKQLYSAGNYGSISVFGSSSRA